MRLPGCGGRVRSLSGGDEGAESLERGPGLEGGAGLRGVEVEGGGEEGEVDLGGGSSPCFPVLDGAWGGEEEAGEFDLGEAEPVAEEVDVDGRAHGGENILHSHCAQDGAHGRVVGMVHRGADVVSLPAPPLPGRWRLSYFEGEWCREVEWSRPQHHGAAGGSFDGDGVRRGGGGAGEVAWAGEAVAGRRVMGVEHFLVDDEGKNVLDVHKWYALRPEDWGNVTEADIRAASPCDKLGGDVGWLVEAALSWVREVVCGRRVRLVTDCGDVEEQCWLDGRTFKARPGWTVYSAFYRPLAIADGERPWPPSEAARWVALDGEYCRSGPVVLPLPEGASGWFETGEES